jgi:K+-transporting ATPase ATPase A chain
MTFLGWLTIFLFVTILTALALVLGRYMAAVYTGEHVFLERLLGGPERLLNRILRVDATKGQNWKQYAKSLIIFSLAGWLLLYFILRTQGLWNFTGLNPEHFTRRRGT